MEIQNYPPNSHKYKEEQKKIAEQKNEKRVTEKVVTGTVKRKKKGIFDKFMGNIISEEAPSVKSYIFGDVLIPAIKKAISDIVTDGIDIILYGESKRGRGRSTADRVSYRNYYDGGYSRPRANDRQAMIVNQYSYDDIILPSRGEAEDVLARMDELMDTYGLVRVADLYDLVGITGNYTDNKYGWNNITRAEIVRTRDGFMIKMPRAIPID